MQGKGVPLPLQPIPKTKTKTNNKIKVVYTEDLTHPLRACPKIAADFCETE
jgi:hypothetical protein